MTLPIAGFAIDIIGYLTGTPGALLGGWLYAFKGSWTMALWSYTGTAQVLWLPWQLVG